MSNYFETGEYPWFFPPENEIRNGRSARDGYARGWGLEFGGLREDVLADPVYRDAYALASGRTIQAENCRIDIFLIVKYFLPKLLDQGQQGSIVEFGSFRGGSAIFFAAVCERLGLDVKVYGLDTFQGMPATDKTIDAHNPGDFGDVDLDELRGYVRQCGLDQRLEFVQGPFEETAPDLLGRAGPVLLSHIDCDIQSSVAYAWEVVKPHVHPGGYVVFDDAHASGCLGATEVVEELVIRRDGLNCEQIWPHFVFRVWHAGQVPADGGEPASSSNPAGQTSVPPGVARSDVEATDRRAQLDAARGEIARLRQQYLEVAEKLSEARQDILRIEDLSARFGTLSEQVTMAKRSRWLKLGRLFGVGPQFEIPE